MHYPTHLSLLFSTLLLLTLPACHSKPTEEEEVDYDQIVLAEEEVAEWQSQKTRKNVGPEPQEVVVR